MKIYVCSPLSGDIKNNMKKAARYCRQVIDAGHMPVCSHIYFPQFLDDTNPAERAIGVEQGLEWLKGCSQLWYWGRPAAGMTREIYEAQKQGIEVVKKC